MNDETPEVTRRVVLPATIGDVWQALTDATLLSDWLGGDVEIDPRPSGAICLDDGESVRRGAIDTFIERERISFIWYVDEDQPTEVVFELEELEAATVLRIIERPFVWEFDSADPAWIGGTGEAWLVAGVR